MLIAAVASLVLGVTPFAPLSETVLSDPSIREVLSRGDLVIARPELSRGRRVFTGLARVERSCDAAHRILSDPTQYPRIYAMFERVKLRRRTRDLVEFDVVITAGPGSAKRRMTTRLLPGRVLHTVQEVGQSTWHFLDAGENSCILHFTHDEDFTQESMVLRMALSGKDAIVQGIQAAAAVTNVRNVRRSFAEDPEVAPPDPELGRVLGRFAAAGTTAFLPYGEGEPAWVVAQSRGSAEQVLGAARSSERWAGAVPLFQGKLVRRESSQVRRMSYALDSLFEEVEFETRQVRDGLRIVEQVRGGDLQTGGWRWLVIESQPRRALLLVMNLKVDEGDWLVGQISKYDRTASDGTSLGIAFMLVENVAAMAAPAQARSAP